MLVVNACQPLSTSQFLNKGLKFKIITVVINVTHEMCLLYMREIPMFRVEVNMKFINFEVYHKRYTCAILVQQGVK